VKVHASAKDAVVEARGRSRDSRRKEPPPGMRRIDPVSSGLSAEEENNHIKVQVGVHSNVDVTVFVPADTSLKLSTVNGGNITVEGVSGEIDANNVNGSVTLTNVSGAVVAHALNGKVQVELNRVVADKAMSFSTLNGDVDVTLPADARANLKMKSENGEIFSDFEIQLKPSSAQPVSSGGKGKYKLRFDRALYGSINGGGPEFSFTTLNGTIYLRKK
jgi:DUF4097 and DUF4098 domain-containing protein YvlB